MTVIVQGRFDGGEWRQVYLPETHELLLQILWDEFKEWENV